LAGQVYPFSYHQKYFEREVLPRLAQMPNAIFIDSPSAEHKRQLLREAKAVLITSQADETSSLVAMEAAASGTPVIAFRRGALPEVVKDGVTGFLVDNMEEAVAALQHVDHITPSACIAHVQENFSSRRMANDYEHLYSHLMQTINQAAQAIEAA
jgi:glycosyltransferase involved in cell wall biosynthesis